MFADHMTFESPIAAYIRKSLRRQDESRQEADLRDFISRHQLSIADENWFSDSGSRHHSEKRQDFQRLLALIQSGQIKTVLISELDRFGTKDSDELFMFRHLMQAAGCKCWAIKDQIDLTGKDIQTLINLVFKAEGSRQSQLDTGRRVASARRNLATQGAVGQDGRKPCFGYDKAVLDSKGNEVWRLHYLSPKDRVQVFPDGKRKEIMGGKDERGRSIRSIPVKNKDERYSFVPSMDAERTGIVRMMFDLWTTQAISLRQIAKRINLLGLYCYGHAWNSITVRNILANPAYQGDYASYRFNPDSFWTSRQTEDGLQLVQNEDSQGNFRRDRKDWCTHEGHGYAPLVTREVWQKAQEKLDTAKSCIAPRKPEYWLKNFLYCGHCKAKYTARTHHGVVEYYCSGYHDAQRKGLPSSCPCQYIRHDAVLEFLTTRLGQLKVTLAEPADASESLSRLARQVLAKDSAEASAFKARLEFICASMIQRSQLRDQGGADVCARFLHLARQLQSRGCSEQDVWIIYLAADILYCDEERQRLAEAKARHARITNQWLDASPQMQAVLRGKVADLEAEISLRAKTSEAITDQLDRLRAEKEAAFASFCAAYEALEGSEERVRAESLREVLSRVDLFIKKGACRRERNSVDETQTVMHGAFTSGSYANTVLTLFAQLSIVA